MNRIMGTVGIVLVLLLMGVGCRGKHEPPHFRKAKADLVKPRMAVIENALNEFKRDCGRLPDEAEGGLDALLTSPPALEGRWKGPYCKKSQFVDPWGNPYVYVREGQVNSGSFDLISYGADGQEGGEGENADVVND